MELFLVRIFPYSDSYLSVFSPDAGKYGPEITPYLDTFHAVVNQRRYLRVNFLQRQAC